MLVTGDWESKEESKENEGEKVWSTSVVLLYWGAASQAEDGGQEGGGGRRGGGQEGGYYMRESKRDTSLALESSELVQDDMRLNHGRMERGKGWNKRKWEEGRERQEK